MIKKGFIFAIQLAVILIVVAALHMAYLYANQITISNVTLLLCYGINFFLALLIYLTLLRMAQDQSRYIGFAFLIGSALKFMAYFLIFEPLFKQDGDLSRIEFFLFFTPYLVSLVAETLALVKLMRTLH